MRFTNEMIKQRQLYTTLNS